MARNDPNTGATVTDTPPTLDTRFFGHPRGLSTLFFTEMWERFSYYGLRPLLVLFMSAALLDGGFGFDRNQASAIVGIYAASVYLASLPGGWVADRILGLRRAIMYGAVFISLGHLSIGFASFAHSRVPFFLASTAFFSASLSTGDFSQRSASASRSAALRLRSSSSCGVSFSGASTMFSTGRAPSKTPLSA